MGQTFCVICKIFHEPNDACPVYVPMLTAVPQCPSCAALRAKLDREKLAKVLLDAQDKQIAGKSSWTIDPLITADAIIAYMREG